MLQAICPLCDARVGIKEQDVGKLLRCPACTGHFVAPRFGTDSLLATGEPVRGSVRELAWTLRLIRLRQRVRSAADLLRLGTGTGERLCAALILCVVVAATVLAVAFVVRCGTANGLLLAGGVLLGTFLPSLILILWGTDEELEADRPRVAAGVAEARQARVRRAAAIRRAEAERADALAEEEARVRRATHEWEVTVACPYCKEQIHPDALKCKHCGEILDRDLRRQRERNARPDSVGRVKRPGTRTTTFLTVVGVLLAVTVAICCAGGFVGGDRGSRQLTEEEVESSAKVAAEGFVKQYLKSPATAKFVRDKKCERLSEPNEYIVVGSVDAQNSFGAMIRSTYGVHLRYDPERKVWTLLDPPILESR